MFWKIILKLINNHQSDTNNWNLERERLLNRIQSRDWQTYTQLQSTQVTNQDDSVVVGLGSDAVELERSGYPSVNDLDFNLSALIGDNYEFQVEPTIGADG